MTDPAEDFFLWHLAHLGVIRPAQGGWTAPLWTQAAEAEPVTVALIDTGIDTGHPNLAGALAGPQIDFGPRLTGVVYSPAGPRLDAFRRALAQAGPEMAAPAALERLGAAALAAIRAHARETGPDAEALAALESQISCDADPAALAAALEQALGGTPPAPHRPDYADPGAALAALDLPQEIAKPLLEAAEALCAGHETLPLEDPATYFGAHGTACAGLIGGRPPQEAAAAGFGALPYRGVNPFCRLLSYATPYSHELRPVTHALLAAYLAGAQVIVVPRGLPDLAARDALPPSPLRRTRLDPGPNGETETALLDEDLARRSVQQADAAILEALMAAIARRRYLVLSAGNDGRADALAYPASALAETSSAVIVAACNRHGVAASYSNGTDLGPRVIRMLSDDAPVADRERLRLDPTRRVDTDFDFAAHGLPGSPPAREPYSPWAPLSLDVRGAYGYAASELIDAPETAEGGERSALYAMFGGTSAASALTGGLIALLLQAGRLDAIPPGDPRTLAEALRLDP